MTDLDTETITIPADNGPVDVKSETAAQDAPWGLKPDGTPYKRDPAIYANRGKKAARKPAKGRRKATGPDYTSDVAGVLQLTTIPLVMAGTRKPEFMADAYVIGKGIPEVADAVNDLAQSDPRIEAIVQRLTKVGPYGALIATVMPIAIQVAVNHRAVPPGFMGTADPADILAVAAAEGEAVAMAGTVNSYGPPN